MSSSRRALGTFVVLALVVLAVYGRALDAPFIFDDLPAVVHNPSIVRLWPLIGDAEAPGPLDPPPLAPTSRRPLPNYTLALNYHFGRVDPAGYRVFSLIVHVLTAALLASIVARTLCLPFFGGAFDRVASPLSLIVALVWAVHPLNTEAVVYVTQRTELLAALFYLTTGWAALRYWTAPAGARRAAWITVATLAALAGAASKEIIVSVPLVLLLFEWTFFGRTPAAALRGSWPLYLGLVPSWVLLVLLSVSGVGGLSDARHRVPLLVWWLTQTKVLLLYLKLAIWPWPLSIHYAPGWLPTFAAAWPSVAAVAILAIATLVLLGRRYAAGFVAAAAFLMLAPTLVVPLPKVVAAERRMYLPMAGLVTLAIVAAYRWIAQRPPSTRTRLSVVTATVLVAAASFFSVLRLGAYQTAVTIWEDAVLHQPDDAMAHYNLGVALLDADRPRDATAHFEQALRIEPDHTGALDNLGAALNRLGRPQDAIAQFEQALKIDPNDTVAHNNLGAVLTSLGRPREAIDHLNRALQLDPEQPKAKVHANLGKALVALGRLEDAVAQFEEALKLDPDDVDAHYGFGGALMSLGRPEDAVRHFEAAVRRQPDWAEAHNNLGVALLAAGRTDDAIAQLEQTLRLKPYHANASYNLGNALLDSGRPREAIDHFQAALQGNPDDAHARLRCAIAYARTNQPGEAVAMAERGLTLARSQGETALAAEIDAWLQAQRGTTTN